LNFGEFKAVEIEVDPLGLLPELPNDPLVLEDPLGLLNPPPPIELDPLGLPNPPPPIELDPLGLLNPPPPIELDPLGLLNPPPPIEDEPLDLLEPLLLLELDPPPRFLGSAQTKANVMAIKNHQVVFIFLIRL